MVRYGGVMTDTRAGAPARGIRPLLRAMGRTPATLTMIGLILLVGLLSHGLWTSFRDGPGMDIWATGLPAFEAGRWWTAVTATFFVGKPWAILPVILLFSGMGVLEFIRGSRVALAYFWVGQLFGVFTSALLLTVAQLFPTWPWAVETSQALQVGATAGAFACIAAVTGLLRAGWRTRAWLGLLTIVIIGVLVFGTVGDIERAAAVLLVLIVDRTLRPQHATVHEQRLVAFVGMIAFVAIEVILSLVPTDGPFGSTEPFGGWSWSVTFDVLIIVLIANGLRRARRWAWVTALILLAINVAGAVVLAVIASYAVELQVEDSLDGTPIDIGTGALALIMMIYLMIVRGAFARRRRTNLMAGEETTRADAAAMIRATGGGTLSWMTTWAGNSYFRTSTGMVAFQERAGAAIALADPLGPEEGRAASVTEFIAAAEHAGLVPCLFSASEATRAAVPNWQSLVVADDTIVDLPGLAFTGKAWNSVRTSLNRANREGMTFRLTHLQDEPWGVRAQLRAISEEWVGDKDLPEMRFTLGTLEEAADPAVRIALAIDATGSVDGFLTWLPVYGDDGIRGWTLDLMRRREHGFGPVMEYLIGSSAVAFRDEGASIMSLSGAPLTHEYPPEARLIATLSARLAEGLEPVYGFQSLHRFKDKFNPRYETLYLVFRDDADLARIGAGLTRAFLPNATAGQFTRAGLELVRGNG